MTSVLLQPRKAAWLTSASIIACVLPAMSTAAEAQDQVPSEIIVTAQRRVETLQEVNFRIERERLELEMRAANARLAEAIEEEHSYGPKVSAAIDDVHIQMGELQKATVRHVFAMRALLNERQQQVFDRQVSASLTGTPRE